MEILQKLSGDTLYMFLRGEIDEHSASQSRKRADLILDEHLYVKRVVFNLRDIGFMDSTGIGFLIGRYKKLKKFGVSCYIAEPNLSADKILAMSGIYSIIPKINDAQGVGV